MKFRPSQHVLVALLLNLHHPVAFCDRKSQNVWLKVSDDVNAFGCGAIHWLGIIPFNRANDNSSNHNEEGEALMPLAKWLFDQPNIDMHGKQNQGHTVLHKAAFGGHLALIRYLHEEYNMYDDITDFAGNYAADNGWILNLYRLPASLACLLCQRSRRRVYSGILDFFIDSTLLRSMLCIVGVSDNTYQNGV